MSLFRRKNTDGPISEGTEGVEAVADDEELADGESDAEETVDRSRGPWDESEVEELDQYIDLGSLALRLQEGMELRLELEQETGRVISATIQLSGSAVQLQAFAAPRTEGIWDDIRTEIAASIERQKGSADEVPGVFGRELLARVPVRNPDGRTGHQAVRFTGIDGPRWFLRAVFHGAAAYDPEQAKVLEDVVRSIVVRRGPDAMAPRDLLPLRLPDDANAEPEQEPEGPTLDPFTRGPEITEIH